MRHWIKAPLAILAEHAGNGLVVENGRIVELVSAGAADASGAGIIKLLGSTIAQHSINRTYAPATLTVELKDGDLTGLKLAVAETGSTAVASH